MKRETSGVELLVVLALTVPVWLLTGWVASMGWAWFVVPLGAPQIGAAHAMGLASVVGVMTLGHASDKRASDQPLARLVGTALGLLLALGYMALVHAVAF